MTDIKTPTFEETINWASEESKRLTNKSSGFSTTYLIIAGIIIFILVFIILMLAGIEEDDGDVKSLKLVEEDEYTYESVLEEVYDAGESSIEIQEYTE